jgi:hypothetical protein
MAPASALLDEKATAAERGRMTSSIVAIILGLLQAIPILDRWFQQIAVAYARIRLDQMKKENLDAIRKAIEEHDQRNLETVIGSPTAGKPSGDPGAVIVDRPPPNVGDPVRASADS